MRPMPHNSSAAGLVAAIQEGVEISNAAIVDFGINSKEHFNIMAEAVLEGHVTANKLWEAINSDYDIDSLVEPVNPDGLHFQSIYATFDI